MTARQAKKVLRILDFHTRGAWIRKSTARKAGRKANRAYARWERAGRKRTLGDRTGRWDHEYPIPWGVK